MRLRFWLCAALVGLWWTTAHAATVTKGKTFGSTEEVTAAKLHQLVDSGTVTNLTQADVATDEGLVKHSTSAPSDTDQQWNDTSYTIPIGKISDGSTWQPISPCYARLTNRSGAQRTAGDVVILDSSNNSSYTTTTSASNDAVLGVVMETVANTSTGLVAVCGGPFTVKVAAAVSRGGYLVTSTTAAQADDVASLEDGVFGVALTASVGAGTVEAILRSR